MTALAPDARPRLVVGARLQFDAVRDCWFLQAPERLFQPDEIALEILKRCDGAMSLAMIIEDLARSFDADPSEIDSDVRELLEDLLAKRIIST